MKKIAVFILAALMMFSASSFAGGNPGENKEMFEQTLTLTGSNNTGSLNPNFKGYYIYTVYVYSAADSDIDFKVSESMPAGSVDLFNETEINGTATGGYKKKAATAWPITQTPTYTAAGVGSTTYVRIVGAR